MQYSTASEESSLKIICFFLFRNFGTRWNLRYYGSLGTEKHKKGI